MNLTGIQFLETIQRLPPNAISLNGGYVAHYLKHPNQLLMNGLIILSGVSTGLLNVPSLLALQTLDHDSADIAIDAQIPGMLIMGCCSSIAQINFLLSDLIDKDGAVYKYDHMHLSNLQAIHKIFLESIDLTNLDAADFSDKALKKAVWTHMSQCLVKETITAIMHKKTKSETNYEIKLPEINFKEWFDKIESGTQHDNAIYSALDIYTDEFKNEYALFIQMINKDLKNIVDRTEEELYQDIKGKIVSSLSVNKGDQRIDSACDLAIKKQLYEFLRYTPDGQDNLNKSKSDTRIIQNTEQWGIILSYVNVFVNILIGIGAFFALGQFVFWLTGTHLAIFMLAGVLGWTVKIAFACLCTIGAYLYTRHDIQTIFKQMGYQIVLWKKNPNKWKSLRQTIKKPRVLFTIAATLPAAIGIAIINALGFYIAMPASPIILALAVLVFVSTVIAIIALLGRRMYQSYPRFEYYWHEFKSKIGMYTCNLILTAAVLTTILMYSAHLPILLSFWSVTPFSTILLVSFIGIIVFSTIMATMGTWRMKTAFSTAVGSICVVATMVTVFVALTPVVGTVVAALVGLASSVLFFSFFVSSIMVNDVNEREYVILRHVNPTAAKIEHGVDGKSKNNRLKALFEKTELKDAGKGEDTKSREMDSLVGYR